MTEYFSPENEIYARYIAIGFFALCTLILSISAIRKHKFSREDFFKNNTLPAISFFLLLSVSIFHKYIGITATIIFVLTAVLHYFYNKKFYKLHKIFYFLFLYILLLIIGTISTPKGFRFPDSLITLLVLPLSLCLIDIKQETLLTIAKTFTRVMIVYMLTCILYWLYNYQYLDITLFDWITGKSGTTILPDGFETGNARLFVTMWGGYCQPTYISFVLFMGLVSGCYLFYKNKLKTYELAIYSILLITVILLMESRIAIVAFPVVTITSLVFYSVLKKKYLVPSLLSAFIIGGLVAFFILNSKNEETYSITEDVHRSTYYPMALDYIKEHPYWGCGYNEQLATLDTIIKQDSIPVKKHLRFVHNQFLGDMLQYGIVGLAMLLTLLGGIFFYTIKWRSYPLFMFLIVLLLYMMIEEPLYVQTGITKFTIFLVFFVALTNKSQEHTSFRSNLSK